ncbi:ParB N-terminal domain-containing protein [Paracoccus sp. SCSIO 75233]|uniref:ParB/RepB/Spo0J family partition protein n=1 Tax=Paracoccus sp. SCSIO 75233 TaxID=3017782 RepID=UPI0022F12DB4|nr:ParB N-terminal domain-containing protein [Paracoccus sp. SCSIO 75233]WBU52871.1 ParB N-terminal domain-containing protein [Paracoccus sp. SCSIO 75233]
MDNYGRLETPSGGDLERIEEEFRRETSDRPTPEPVAQVAAESTARLKSAQEQGLLMVEIPLDEIDEGAMIRDRMTMSEEAITELRLSIAAHGLRLPIEVFEMENPGAAGQRYGLLSGYRRLLAVRGLLELTEAEKHRTIRAIIRPRADTGSAFISMIEENEVREELSHFERGRIAVIAANQGAFANTEDAVDKLYATGSKAKRSKIRSFALIFEELGDMLQFPERLSEKRGLRLAAALRRGAETELRSLLSQHTPENADQEWTILEPAISDLEAAPRDTSRGGRPRSTPPVRYGWTDDQTLVTSAGITIRRARDGRGHILRFEGEALTVELMDSLMLEIRSLLEK